MMSFKLITTSLAVAALTATPVLAAPAAPASKLSVASSVRASKATGRSEKLEGTGAIVAAVLAAGVVIGGIIAVANDDDSDSN